MVLVLCLFDSVTWLCSCSCSCCRCCCCCCCCCCCWCGNVLHVEVVFLGCCGIDSGGPKIGLMLEPPFRAKIATKNKLRLSILWRVRTSLAWAPRTPTEVLVLHGLGPVPLWFSDLALFLFLFLLLLVLLLLLLLWLLLMYDLFTCWSRFFGSFWNRFWWAKNRAYVGPPPSGPKSPLKTNCGWVFFEESEHPWPGPPEPLVRYWFFMVLVLCLFDSVTWLCSCSCSCCCWCCCCCCCWCCCCCCCRSSSCYCCSLVRSLLAPRSLLRSLLARASGGPKIGLMSDPPSRAKIATKNKLRLSILWKSKHPWPEPPEFLLR